MGHRVAILAGRVAGTKDDSVYDAQQTWLTRSWPQRIVDGLWYRIAGPATRRPALRELSKTARRMATEQALQIIETEESFGTSSWVQRVTSVPVCIRLHGPWFLTAPAVAPGGADPFRGRIQAEGKAIATAAAVSAPSRDVLERVRSHYGIELDHAEVIPNPTLPVSPDHRWRVDECDRDRVLFVGRFDRVKGGDLMIEAFRRVLQRAPRSRLCFAGPDRGLVGDDGRSWKLEDFVRDRIPGALESGRVEWLGQQPFRALAPLRRQAMVTVVCSRYESFSYTAAEAMALGCPMVAAQVGGIPEIVHDHANGLLHQPGDAEDLAEKIVALLEDPVRAAQLGSQAAADCERLYYPDVVATRLVAFYRRVIERGAGRP
jgi:glycosyltransferase involved in cell wall biosynthesis